MALEDRFVGSWELLDWTMQVEVARPKALLSTASDVDGVQATAGYTSSCGAYEVVGDAGGPVQELVWRKLT